MKTLMLLVVAAFALAACGGGGAPVSSKQDAAKVAQRLQSMGTSSTTAQSLTAGLINVNVNGKSGKMSASVDMQTNMSGTGVDISYAIDATFSGYSPDGKNTYDGTEHESYTVHAGSLGGTASGSVTVTINSDVTVSGEYASKVKVDLTMTLDATAMTGSGSVSMVLNGTVIADGTTYTFDHETISVEASSS
jgi:hypothetical protein